MRRKDRGDNGFYFAVPFWLEFGSYGKREFKKRSADQDRLIEEFLKYVNAKYKQDYKHFKKWLHEDDGNEQREGSGKEAKGKVQE